jgi:hypothetical protein
MPVYLVPILNDFAEEDFETLSSSSSDDDENARFEARTADPAPEEAGGSITSAVRRRFGRLIATPLGRRTSAGRCGRVPRDGAASHASVDGDEMTRFMNRRRSIPGRPMLAVVTEPDDDAEAPMPIQDGPCGVSVRPVRSLLPRDRRAPASNVSLFEWARTVPRDSRDVGRITNRLAANCSVHVHICTGLSSSESDAMLMAVARSECVALLARHNAMLAMGGARVRLSEVVVVKAELSSVRSMRMCISYLLNSSLHCRDGCVFVVRLCQGALASAASVGFIEARVRECSVTLHGVPDSILSDMCRRARLLHNERQVVDGCVP